MSSSAERMRDLRERQRLEDASRSAEDEYVQRELAVTRSVFGDDPVRLARSERYLRWRFQGHQRGEVAYL